jgi:hypothetical protein
LAWLIAVSLVFSASAASLCCAWFCSSSFVLARLNPLLQHQFFWRKSLFGKQISTKRPKLLFAISKPLSVLKIEQAKVLSIVLGNEK